MGKDEIMKNLKMDHGKSKKFHINMSLKFYLEDLFGSSVDLLTKKGIRPEILPTVEQEAIYVS